MNILSLSPGLPSSNSLARVTYICHEASRPERLHARHAGPKERHKTCYVGKGVNHKLLPQRRHLRASRGFLSCLPEACLCDGVEPVGRGLGSMLLARVASEAPSRYLSQFERRIVSYIPVPFTPNRLHAVPVFFP